MDDRRWRNIGVSHEEAFPAQRPCRANRAARDTIGCNRLGGDVAVQAPSRIAFTAFAHEVEPRLRYALVAACGTQRGVDATVDALEWAWEHWDKVEHAGNPAGYLYRVARRRAMRDPSRTLPLQREPVSGDDKPWVEPGLNRGSRSAQHQTTPRGGPGGGVRMDPSGNGRVPRGRPLHRTKTSGTGTGASPSGFGGDI